MPHAAFILELPQRLNLRFQRADQKHLYAVRKRYHIQIIHQSSRIPGISSSPKRACIMMTAHKIKSMEEQACGCICQIFQMDKELTNTFLNIVFSIEKHAHSSHIKSQYIKRIIPKLHVIIRINRHMLKTAFFSARKFNHCVVCPFFAHFQILGFSCDFIQIRKRQERRHAVHILRNAAFGYMFVKPVQQIIQHGLFAGISIVFIQAEQRNPLEPIPIIHVVSFTAAGKYGLILP